MEGVPLVARVALGSLLGVVAEEGRRPQEGVAAVVGTHLLQGAALKIHEKTNQ